MDEICPNCGYSRNGLGPAEQCPECGTASPSDLARLLGTTRSWRSSFLKGTALLRLSLILTSIWFLIAIVPDSPGASGQRSAFVVRTLAILPVLLTCFAGTFFVCRPHLWGPELSAAYASRRRLRIALVACASLSLVVVLWSLASPNVRGLDTARPPLGVTPKEKAAYLFLLSLWFMSLGATIVTLSSYLKWPCRAVRSVAGIKEAHRSSIRALAATAAGMCTVASAVNIRSETKQAEDLASVAVLLLIVFGAAWAISFFRLLRLLAHGAMA